MASTTDGFELARMDLELRREGDILGDAQSGGRSTLRLLRAVDDAQVRQDVRAWHAALDWLQPMWMASGQARPAIAALREQLFSRLVARLPRRRFVAWAYRSLVLCLVGFGLLVQEVVPDRPVPGGTRIGIGTEAWRIAAPSRV